MKNEKVADICESYEQYTRHTDMLKMMGKVKHCGYCLQTVALTVTLLSNACQKKTLDANARRQIQT